MLTKSTLKLVTSLKQKKYRKETGLFVVEGKKSVLEFLNSDFHLQYLIGNQENFMSEFPYWVANSKELAQMSSLTTSPEILAVFNQKTVQDSDFEQDKILALDQIQDPGNLGTIIRLADWFGISQIICSADAVDVYNPKVIQASMGSLTRVRVDYLDLNEFLAQTNHSVVGTFMNGKNLYTTTLPQKMILILGNESNGISKQIEQFCHEKITIPQAGNSTESLNVAMATSVILSEWFRQENYLK